MSQVRGAGFGILVMLSVWWGAQATVLRAQPDTAPPTTKKAASGTSHTANLQRDLKRASELLDAQKLPEFMEEFFPVDILREIRRRSRVKVAAATAKLQPEAVESLTQLGKLLKQSGAAKISLYQDDSLALVRITLVPSKDKPAPVKPAAPPKVAVPGLGQDVAAALKEALRLLEAGDFRGFAVRTFPLPEAERLQVEKDTDETALRIFANPELAVAMEADLQAMSKSQPKYNSDKTEAEYALQASPERAIGARTVKLQLVGGNWRFYDHTSGLRQKIRTGDSASEPEGPEEFVLQWERFGNSWRLFKMEIESGEGFPEPESQGRPQFAPKSAAPPLAVPVPTVRPGDFPDEKQGVDAPPVPKKTIKKSTKN